MVMEPSTLQVRQVPGFIMHVVSLFIELLVKPSELPTLWDAHHLVKIGLDVVQGFCDLAANRICSTRAFCIEFL
jgi:hypothetical protein